MCRLNILRNFSDNKARLITHLGESDASTDFQKMLLNVLPKCTDNKRIYSRSCYIKTEKIMSGNDAAYLCDCPEEVPRAAANNDQTSRKTWA